jgi:anaerobic selenocysteine-containing dehydrogenase
VTQTTGEPGRLCTKGSTLHLTASAAITLQNRLLQPMQRLERGELGQPVSWNAALDFAAGQVLQSSWTRMAPMRSAFISRASC